MSVRKSATPVIATVSGITPIFYQCKVIFLTIAKPIEISTFSRLTPIIYQCKDFECNSLHPYT